MRRTPWLQLLSMLWLACVCVEDTGVHAWSSHLHPARMILRRPSSSASSLLTLQPIQRVDRTRDAGTAAAKSEKKKARSRNLHALGAAMTDDDEGPEDEEECPSEEECEIDWSKMPFDDEEEMDDGDTVAVEDEVEEEEEEMIEPQQATATSSSTSTQPSAWLLQEFEDFDFDEEEDDEEDEVDSSSSSSLFDPSKVRLRLEMQWGMTEAAEDCEVDQPETCGSEPCLDCRGRGIKLCRFCHGSAILSFTKEEAEHVYKNTIMACTVCSQKGTEQCASCKGTGWVASWTQLPEELESFMD